MLRALAGKAGIAPEWKDQKGEIHEVAPETLRSLLETFGLPCRTAANLKTSLARLGTPADCATAQRLVTARLGEPLHLPPGIGARRRARLVFEDGAVRDVQLADGSQARAVLPGLDCPGYHRLELGERELTIAAAPRRCFTIGDVAPDERIFGVTAQIYSLRRAGDGGIGDLGAVSALAAACGRHGADALALSPVHALFAADPGRFGPYSPSSRLFHNPLHADPSQIFGARRLRAAVERARIADEMQRLEQLELIDWQLAASAKMALFRALFESFEATDLPASPPGELATQYSRFRAEGGELLVEHARFEALHGVRLRQERGAWSWRSWPPEWRDPSSPAVAAFAAEHARDVEFHIFLQWLAERSLATAQEACRRAGMRIGLISDLAIGMDSGGSHAWSRQRDVLVGATVGAPPDYYNANGQNWGLTSFSPHALIAGGFAPYIATLRAALRHAGGLRIDHMMGVTRLWLIPDGAPATEGAYVAYPSEDLFRLIALESLRHRAIVIGEDLGTLPHGFREQLDGQGIAGMQVLRFERDDYGNFRAPDSWRPSAVAMPSTHDLPTTAGWWAGHDIETRARISGSLSKSEIAAERAERVESRHFLWGAFRHARVAEGEEPPPEATEAVADAAARYTAITPCALALLSLEEALGVLDQPNLPGTVDEHPNWRRRLPGGAGTLLDAPRATPRLEALRRRRGGRR